MLAKMKAVKQIDLFASSTPEPSAVLEAILCSRYGFRPTRWPWVRADGSLARLNSKDDPLGAGIVIAVPGEEERTVYTERGLQEALGLVGAFAR